MKHTTAFLLALLLGLTLMAQPPEGKHRSHHPRPEPPKVEQMVSNLSAIQKKRLETISDECKQDMDKLEKELNSVRQKIRSLMETDGDQSDKLFPLIDREAQLQAQMAKTMYRVGQQIDRVLTEEQLTEFRARMKADREKKHNKEIPTPKPENKKKQSKR